MTSKSGELKKRAWLAKQRLKMGYWESVKRENAAVGGGVVRIRRAAVTDVSSGANSVDEKMYQKVCDMLDRDETTLNPIGQLIDNDVYSTLDVSARQRYILELSNKFRELKERYYRERTGA